MKSLYNKCSVPKMLVNVVQTGGCLGNAGWSGVAKVWSVPACKMNASFQAHQERCTGIAWHPHAQEDVPEETLSIATGSADAVVNLWAKTGMGKSDNQPCL